MMMKDVAELGLMVVGIVLLLGACLAFIIIYFGVVGAALGALVQGFCYASGLC